MEWIEKLQVPGLILAGIVIWLLFQLLRERDRLLQAVSLELAENTKTLVKLATLLDVICRKTRSSREDGGK